MNASQWRARAVRFAAAVAAMDPHRLGLTECHVCRGATGYGHAAGCVFRAAASTMNTAEPAAVKCPDCGETKPAAEFHRDASRSTGRGSYCKPCKRARNRRTAESVV